MNDSWKSLEKIIKEGGVAVIPTDTLYGIVASALSKHAVERIYKIKGRDENKPFIILITSYKDLEKFGYTRKTISINLDKLLRKYWPGKLSVVIPIENKSLSKKFAYLHRGTGANAFRMVGPKNRNLYNLLKKVGPLVAPSVNPQGLEPALDIKQAKKYFGDKIDAYLSAGKKSSKPSTLVEIKDGEFKVLRQGAVLV